MKTTEETARNKGRKLSSGEIAAFCSQLSMMVHSGISLYEAMDVLCEDQPEGEGKRLMESIAESIQNSLPLHQALRETGVFPAYAVNMVRVGEEAGRLDEVLSALADYYDNETSTRKTIEYALLCPFILMIMVSAVILIITEKVLPIFEGLFAQLGMQVSSSAVLMMNYGRVIGRVSFVVVLLAVILLALMYFSVKSGGYSSSAGKRPPFFFKKLQEQMAVAKFSSAMYLMTASGMDLGESLQMSSDVVINPIVKAKVEQCASKLETGLTFSQAVLEAKIFPALYAKMISVGSRAGNCEAVLKNLSKTYSDEVDEKLGRIISSTEFILVGLLCVVVGMILLSVILPLLSVMTTMGG